jgi:hypothetical protein
LLIKETEMSKILKLVVFFLAIVIAIPGCDSDETGNLELKFKLKYDGNTLVMFEDQTYPSGFDVFFTRFSFYMSDINLTGNNTYNLSEIEMVNPTASHQDLSSAENGYSMIFSDVPIGDYSGIDFGLGVPSDLNAMDPADFSTNHPLANAGEYWLGWESYVFIKIEGKIDFDGDGAFEEGMSLHVGSDAVFKNASMPKSFDINKGETTIVEIELDLLDIFVSNNTTYDLEGTPRIHSLEQLSQAEQLANNLAQAIPK